jgi:hypothetical protein
MPFTFRKRVPIVRGRLFRVAVNLSKRGVSLSQKLGPVTVTQRRGRTPRVSVDLPGPVGYVTGGKSTRATQAPRRSPPRPPSEPGRFDPYS